jgi:DNA-nicking Smr family endonuclease
MNRFRCRRPPRTMPGTDDDILSYLATHGTQDKDAGGFERERGEKTVRSIERIKRGVLRMALDLHGLTSDEASRRVSHAVESCRGRGIQELLVIHGRGSHSSSGGEPVLKKLVRDMLDHELASRVRGCRAGLPREGGEGVTVVYLK